MTNTAATINSLGKRQRNVLAALARHGSWSGSGWVWENFSTTKTVLTSLLKTGLVEMVDISNGTNLAGEFRPTREVEVHFTGSHTIRLAAEAAEKATEAQETTSLFPESMPSDFAMYTTAGNAAVAAAVRTTLATKGRFFSEDEPGVLRATYAIVNAVAATKGMDEAADTMVRDAIYSALTGISNEWLGID